MPNDVMGLVVSSSRHRQVDWLARSLSETTRYGIDVAIVTCPVLGFCVATERK